MCPCRENVGRVLLGLGIGLLASLVLSGGVLRILLGLALLALGYILLNAD